MNEQFIELGVSLAPEKFIRNLVKPYSEEILKSFREEHQNTDVYASAYRYETEDIRQSKQTGPLYFDLDGKFAQADLKSLREFLISQGCPAESIQILYSGSKGFHLEVPFEVLGLEPRKDLNKVYEAVVKEIKTNIIAPSIDTGIYDAVRLWRLPNSINSKSGLYKIPLTSEEAELALEDIKELAKKPRLDFVEPTPTLWSSFIEIFKKAEKKIKNIHLRSGMFEPVGEGQRNNETFKRALKLKAEGKTQTEAEELCSKIQDNPPLSPLEIERTVASAYSNKYEVTPHERGHKDDDGAIKTSFAVTKTGLILEEIYDPELGEPLFAVFDNGKVEKLSQVQNKGRQIKPIIDDTVTKGSIKLPSDCIEYGSDLDLFEKIKKFIHTYVDIAPDWEHWATYYVLLSWLYDKLPVCPYLCALGPSNTGKTRFVQTVGEICYKPFTASGSITASPIFRILNRFQGTLVLNEFDHIGQFNDEIIVILNNGYEAGLPVIRTEGDETKEIKVFQVFGPKLFSSRKRKSDWAFESRLLTIKMRETRRSDIPPFLLNCFHKEALELRNMLLMFRFRHYSEKANIRYDLFSNVHGRLRQTLLSITSVIQDEAFLNKAIEFAKELEKSLKVAKEYDIDVLVYQALLELWSSGERTPAVKAVAERVRNAADLEKLSSKAVGSIVRDELGFETRRGGQSGNYIILLSSGQLAALKERYETIEGDASEPSSESSDSSEEASRNNNSTELTEHTEVADKEPVLDEKFENPLI